MHNPSDFPIFTSSHRYIQPTVGAQLSIHIHQQRPILLALDGHWRVHDLHLFVGELSVHFYPVDAGEFGLRVLEEAFESVVVGDQQQTLGVEV